MRSFITTLVICLAGTALYAQSFGEINGSVTDNKTHEGIAFANLSLKIGDQIVAQNTTDEFGRFVFSSLEPGTYDLEISSMGYGMVTFKTIRIEADAVEFFRGELVAGIDLPVFKIYADKLVDHGRLNEVMTLKPTDIEHKPIGDIREIPMLAPKVYDRRGDGGSIHIAGSRSDAILYVIDDVRVIGDFHMPMSAIAEVNVITGGIPARYGDVTGGVVEIRTKSYMAFLQ